MTNGSTGEMYSADAARTRNDDNENRIVIVGAGLCGLSAAATLAEKGIKPLLIERKNHIGGLARSIELQGQFFDIGVHTFYRPTNAAVNHMLGLTGIDWLERKNRFAMNVGDGKISPIPELANFLRYPRELKKDLVRRFKRKPGAFDSIEGRLKSSYGDWLYDNFFAGYISKKLPGFSAGDIHGDWWGLGNIRNEFNQFTGGDVAAKKTVVDKAKIGLKWWRGFLFGHKNILIYPHRGIGQIAERLKEFVEGRGVTISFGQEIAGIDVVEGRLKGVRLSDGRSLKTNNLVWTGMLPDLVSHLGMNWPKDLPYISTALAMLVFEKRAGTRRRYFFEYSGDGNLIFQRFYFNDFFSDEGANFGIGCEISYKDIDDLPDDREVTARALDGLKKLDAISDERLVAAKVHREPQTHPVYLIGYKDSLSRVFEKIYSVDGIFPVGRTGAFNNLGMHAALLIGGNIADHCRARIAGSGRDKST